MARWEQSLLRTCFAYLGDLSLAEDAVQETFLKAWKNLDRFRGEASEKTWLLRIAINTCKDVRRSAWFRRVNRAVSLDSLPEAPAPFASRDHELARAVLSLRPQLREAVLLCWYQELSASEAARALGVSRSTVYNRLNKARRRLRGELEAWHEKNDAQIVRDALDRRLAALGPSAARRARIRERIAEEEPAMKKKLTASLAAALIAALLLAGAALAVGLNLFDVFGKNDERLPQLADEAGEMTASVRRTPGGTRRYAGEGEWAGTPLKIEAQFSRAYGRITLKADGVPSALGTDARLEACDETNVPMRCLGMDLQTDGVTYLFNGTGALPGRIAVRLILSEEEGQSVPIELSPVE